MIKFPLLETERLLLTELKEEDADTVYELYSSPEVTRFFGRDLYTSRQQALDFIRSCREGFKMRENTRWGIRLKDDPDKLAGMIGFKRFIWEHYRAEINYELLPAYWNRKIASEAIGRICDFAFINLGLHSLEANIDKENFASMKVLEKNGFVKEAHFRENYFYKGEFIDSVIFSKIFD